MATYVKLPHFIILIKQTVSAHNPTLDSREFTLISYWYKPPFQAFRPYEPVLLSLVEDQNGNILHFHKKDTKYICEEFL